MENFSDGRNAAYDTLAKRFRSVFTLWKKENICRSNAQTSESIISNFSMRYCMWAREWRELPIMDTEEKMVSAKSDYIAALYDYNSSRANLYEAMSIPVDLNVKPYRTALEKNDEKEE